jgi:CrcB protein
MATFLWVGIGGAFGSMARHGVNVLVNRTLGSTLPHATAIVNVIGCLVVGLLAGLVATHQLLMSPDKRALIFVGVMGGFTTFSSLGLDTLTLVQEGRVGQAVGNVALQVGVGLAAVFAGYAAAVSMK